MLRTISILLSVCCLFITAAASRYDSWPVIPIDSMYMAKGQPVTATIKYYANKGNVERTMIYDESGNMLIELWNTPRGGYSPDTLLYSETGTPLAYFSINKQGPVKGKSPEFIRKNLIDADELSIDKESCDESGNWTYAHAPEFGTIKRKMVYENDPALREIVERYSLRRAEYSDQEVSESNSAFLGIFPGEMAMTGICALVIGIIAFLLLKRLPFKFNYEIASTISAVIAGIGLVMYYQSLSQDMDQYGSFIMYFSLMLGVAVCIFLDKCISAMTYDNRYTNSDIKTVGMIWAVFITVVAIYPLLNIWLWTWLAIMLCWIPGFVVYMMIVESVVEKRCPKCHSADSVYVMDIVDDGKTLTETNTQTTTRESKPHNISKGLGGIKFRTTERETTRVKTNTYKYLLVRYACRHCDYREDKRKKGDLLKSTDSSLTTTSEKRWREK